MAREISNQLIPPDLVQCQAMKPNGYTFMTLGGRPGRERCRSKPTVIVTEVVPGKDGRHGSMSLCHPCWAVALKQLGAFAISAEPILPTEEKKNGRLRESQSSTASRSRARASQR